MLTFGESEGMAGRKGNENCSVTDGGGVGWGGGGEVDDGKGGEVELKTKEEMGNAYLKVWFASTVGLHYFFEWNQTSVDCYNSSNNNDDDNNGMKIF